MGDDIKPKDVFIGLTVGQGDNVSNAISKLENPVLKCAAHCLTLVVM